MHSFASRKCTGSVVTAEMTPAPQIHVLSNEMHGKKNKIMFSLILLQEDYSHYFSIDGLVQERRNSSALAMELRLSCTYPSIWSPEHGRKLQRRRASPASVSTRWRKVLTHATSGGRSTGTGYNRSVDSMNHKIPAWFCFDSFRCGDISFINRFTYFSCYLFWKTVIAKASVIALFVRKKSTEGREIHIIQPFL